jgi:osmotically inducible protein OsmC
MNDDLGDVKMPIRSSNAIWEGTLKQGKGMLTVGDGVYKGPYSFASRFEKGSGTNPEELIAAAHAGCFSMALAYGLEQAGYSPEQVKTVAHVHLDKVGDGFQITSIELKTEAKVPGIDEKEFLEQAEAAKSGCPVSQALKGPQIRLQAKLVG